MKKVFIALSILAALFVATPSMALVGTPDAVPGTNILQPFFLVSFDGTLNTLVTITEVEGFSGSVHWTIRDKKSIHRANGNTGYTPYDVVSVSISALLTNVSPDGLAALEVDLDLDGDNDHYMGYVEYDNSNPTADNLIGHQYVINLANGLASGVVLPAREYAPVGVNGPHALVGWHVEQNSFLGTEWLPPIGQLPYPEFTDYEAFTAFSYATSKAREQGYNPHADMDFPIPAYFRLLPRYFLLNDSAETFFFIWSSGNWGEWEQNGLFEPDTNLVVVNIYDEEENGLSGQINLPYELNFVNVRRILPAAWGNVGGWIDVRWSFDTKQAPVADADYPWYYSAVPLASEWLGYSYQYAASDTAALNWGALFEMHRDVGTFVEGSPF